MADDKSISVINAGSLSKPVDTLIKKVSAAVGGVFQPWQIKRVAKAEAETRLIAAKADIEVTDLHRRATFRWFEEEARRQANIETITMKAALQLGPDANAGNMDDDWIVNFFDKSRIISDAEMQALWSSVLAGEANRPGSYSKRTVNFLADLDKRDAEAFVALCRFGWIVGEFTPLVFDELAPIYTDKGIDFDALSHLDSIGLIQFGSVTGFRRIGVPRKFVVAYVGRSLTLELPKDADNELDIGKVLLTQTGKELARICTGLQVDGLEDYVKDVWKEHLPKPPSTEQIGSADPPSAGG